MGRTVKLVWQFKKRWWSEVGWSGAFLCDGALQQVWAEACDAPILCAYVNGSRAMEWAAMGDPVRAGLYELTKIFPASAREFERGWAHLWVNDPYAKGGFSHLAPGFVLGHMEHVGAACGRIHFAGEHTALWSGFIEGALESAERVTQEILTTA